MLIEAEGVGVDQEGDPVQSQARRGRYCLTITIELGSRARETGGGPAQAKRVIASQRRICGPNQTPARAVGQFGDRRPDRAHSARASQHLESRDAALTSLKVLLGLQRR